MAQTIRITIPKELSNKIDLIKLLYPKRRLSKQEWTISFLEAGLKQYDKEMERFKFK